MAQAVHYDSSWVDDDVNNTSAVPWPYPDGTKTLSGLNVASACSVLRREHLKIEKQKGRLGFELVMTTRAWFEQSTKNIQVINPRCKVLFSGFQRALA